MKKLIPIILLGVVCVGRAQTAQEIQYAAYLKASKTMWERSIVSAEKESGSESFERAIAMYGLLNNTMANRDEDTFDEKYDETTDFLKEVIEKNPKAGEPKAVLSSIYGLAMGYSPMKGMFLGGKSSSLMESAMELNPESPMVQKLYAGSKLYTPPMFGGSVEKALAAYERSVALYELGETENNWMYLDTLVGLSMAYSKTDQPDKAKATLEKAIAIEPEYGWAKSILASLNK